MEQQQQDNYYTEPVEEFYANASFCGDETAVYSDPWWQHAIDTVAKHIRLIGRIFAIVGLLAILVKVGSDLLPVALFAYVNCLVYLFFAAYFLKKGTLSSLFPVIMPGWLVTGSCLGVIYFAMFMPDGYYENMNYTLSYFEGGIRYQGVIFLFLISYFLTMKVLLRNEKYTPQSPAMGSRAMANTAVFICMFIIGLNLASNILGLPGFATVWADRLFVHMNSILFVAGALIFKMTKKTKLFICLFLGMSIFLYTLANSRGMAMLPVMAFLAGIFLFSEIKPKAKILLLTAIVIGLPFYMVIGNTVRLLTGEGGGGFEDLGSKMRILKEWKSAARQQPVGAGFFGRMYFTGGNAIVALTPEQIPHRDLSVPGYAREMAVCLIPGPMMNMLIGGKLTGSGINKVFERQHIGNWVLLDYGFNISETSAVEVSFVGHLWLFGGYAFVIAGGVLLALIHGLAAWRIRAAWRINPDKAIFYFAIMFTAILWTTNLDLISHWRAVAYKLLFAFVIFKAVSPLLGVFAGQAEEDNMYY
jgi:hypothetical protein